MNTKINISIILVIVLFVCGFIYLKTNKKFITKIVNNSEYIFGIDVSHYQGDINWEKVKDSHHPIEFVFIRSTMGENAKDKTFDFNWKNSKKQGFKRGAYHYFRPNEDAEKQFENFRSNVNIEVGDFPPVLDVEEMSKNGIKDLQEKVKTWIELAETEYEVKPIIYTGRKFYNHFLKETIKGYPLWIASYNSKDSIENIDWEIHQFSDKIKVDGIKGFVDGNDIKF